MTNPKLGMSASAGRVDRLDVRRPQPGLWLIWQTHRWLLVALLLFICGSAFFYAADIPALVRGTKPAVVQLFCYGQDDKLEASGTGFFISPDGKVLTNYHVIEDAHSVVAKTIDGKRYSNVHILSAPKKDHRDEEDVAELQFDDAKDVPYLSLGSSKDLVEGQRVLVIGSPEGLTGTVSDGLIAAFRDKGTIIQITAPLSHGSSGSPVLDPESGNVIGVALMALKEGQNLNFAISVDAVRNAVAKGLPQNQKPSEEELAQEALRRAREKLKNKDYRGALVLFNLFLFAHPDDGMVYVDRAIVCFELGYPDQAISDFTKAIRLLPAYSEAYYGRGCLYELLNRYADSIKDLSKAIQLDPTRANIYGARANAYDAVGDHLRAKADRKKAKQLMASSGTPAE